MNDRLLKESDVLSIAFQLPLVVNSAFYDTVKALPSADKPQEVIAQVTFDEEKLREIVKEAVKRFKEEYEVTDRPQGEWIPCKERLPSENDEYIITMGKDGFDKEGNVTWAMFDKLKKKFYFPGGRVNYYIAVTAWMPKPKPWKGINNE